MPIVRRGALVAMPDLAGREVLEHALGVEGGQRAGQVLAVLGREMTTHEGGELLVHEQSPAIVDV